MNNENMTNGDRQQMVMDDAARLKDRLSKRPFYAGRSQEQLTAIHGADNVFDCDKFNSTFTAAATDGSAPKFIFEDDKGNIVKDGGAAFALTPGDREKIHRAFVPVRRKSDGAVGRVEGQDRPRIFWNFERF